MENRTINNGDFRTINGGDFRTVNSDTNMAKEISGIGILDNTFIEEGDMITVATNNGATTGLFYGYDFIAETGGLRAVKVVVETSPNNYDVEFINWEKVEKITLPVTIV